MRITLTALLLALTSGAFADDRLWGTWEGVDPEDEATLILTFSEDGSFSMSSPDMTGDEFSFEELFEEMLSDMELSQDELNALGFEPPVIDRISIAGRWATQGDSLKVWMSNALFYIEGQPPLGMDELMIEVLTQIASLPLENEDLVDMLNLFIALIPLAFEEMLEEELLFEEIYYFLDGQLVITSAEGEPITLSRQDADATAVQDMSWGQIKARWP